MPDSMKTMKYRKDNSNTRTCTLHNLSPYWQKTQNIRFHLKLKLGGAKVKSGSTYLISSKSNRAHREFLSLRDKYHPESGPASTANSAAILGKLTIVFACTVTTEVVRCSLSVASSLPLYIAQLEYSPANKIQIQRRPL